MFVKENLMDLDYDKAVALQGSWGYTPTTPLVDQQAKDTKESQSCLHQLVTQAIQNNSHSRGKEE